MPQSRSPLPSLFLILLIPALLVLNACASEKPRPQTLRPSVAEVRDVPVILRNIIRTETTIRGAQPVLVSGYGFVVGLNGTGSGDVPGPVRALVEQQLIEGGVSSELGGAFRDISPSRLIDHPDTAVVLVQAIIAPGAPAGSRFDVDVRSLPGTSTTSLQGGRLYTTDLRPGIARPLAPDTQSIATARGEVFINPFSDPAQENAGASLRRGRILNGGVVTNPFDLALFLDTPSHGRARAVAQAINARFPRLAGRESTARGIDDEVIEVTIPPEFRDNPREFVELLRHTRIDVANGHRWAARYVEALKETPELATSLTWCLMALGDVSIPYVRKLYDYSEIVPRLAALQAGARLGDPTTRPHLEEVIEDAPPQIRRDAIGLLGELPPDPSVNQYLRDILDSNDLFDRIAAFEALDARRDPWVTGRAVGDKFLLATVPSQRPMVYVTQQGMPKIVLFGDDLSLRRPLFVAAWQDRLLVNADRSDQRVSVMYRDYRTKEVTQAQVQPSMDAFVEFLARDTSPEDPRPGLGLSYSEVVGALYEVIDERGVIGAGRFALFVPEQDRLQAELVAGAYNEFAVERPETAGDVWTEEQLSERQRQPEATETEDDEGKPTYVVPLRQPPPSSSDGDDR